MDAWLCCFFLQGGPGGVQNWAFKDVSNAYSEGFGFLKPDVNNINRWKRGLQVRPCGWL